MIRSLTAPALPANEPDMRNPDSSYFVGPTTMPEGLKERRKERRRWSAIVRLGHTEPVEALIAVNMIVAGSVRYFAPASDSISVPYSSLLGVAMIVAALVGLLGLTTRSTWIRCTYAGVAGLLRIWLMYFLLVADWRNPSWVSHGVAALALGWVFIRVYCKAIIRHERRKKIESALSVE